MIEHYDMLLSHYGTHQGMKIARKHIGWYVQDWDNTDDIRRQINTENDASKIIKVLETITH